MDVDDSVDDDRLAGVLASREVGIEDIELERRRTGGEGRSHAPDDLEQAHGVTVPRKADTVRAVPIVNYALENKVAILTMDDGKANALSQTMLDELIVAIGRAEQEASAIVLAGRADRFCAGFDLRVMMSGPDNAKALLTTGSKVLMKLYGTPLPLVIACTGHAMAGGALVVLTGDYRVCAQGAYKIGLNEVSLGMPVPVLAMELARDRLSKRELVKATLMGTIYDPDNALRVGYVDAVVAPDQVLATATAEAAKLGALSRNAYQATKKRLRGATIDHVLGSLASDMKDLMMPTA
jgi:enoyl-CoA hydratase